MNSENSKPLSVITPNELVKAMKDLDTPPEALTTLRNWFDTHVLEVGSQAVFDGVALTIQKIPENAVISQALSQNMPHILNAIIRRGFYCQDTKVADAPPGARVVHHSLILFRTAEMVGPEELELKKPVLLVKP